MRLLALETSCDETSAAVLSADRILSNVVASQVALHAEYGGVVPELAAREHLARLPAVLNEALDRAATRPTELTAIASTLGPGLPQALLVGARAAQSMAYALGLPYLGVHHHEAHLYSPWIDGRSHAVAFDTFEPHVSLIVSGGHTMLVHVPSELRHRVLGATLDDAAGECFDKVGKLLGLPYPGGPLVDRLASQGRPDAFEFPRPLLREANDNFSFSGLKTSVRYFLEKRPGLADDPAHLRDLCASVQAAIVDVLVTKLLQAARRLGVGCVTASGGVTCNSGFRARLTQESAQAGLRLQLASPAYCTDNAAMIGVLAVKRLAAGDRTNLDEEIRPGWSLEDVAG